MKKIKNMNGYAIYQAGARDVKKYGYTDGDFYVYFASDVRDFGLPNSTPEFEGCGNLEEAEANCAGNFAIAREIVEDRTTAASMEEILEVEAMLDAGADPESLNEYDGEDQTPELQPALTMELTLTIGPEQAAAIVEAMRKAFEGALEFVQKLADWIGVSFRKAVGYIGKSAACLADFLLYHANDRPKWWHLYKHAKKARTRKKYRRLLMQQLTAKLAAVT